MITIANVQSYSINLGKEIAYQITYSDGTNVRAVESFANGVTFRKEHQNESGEWVLSGKPYVVAKNKKRNAEKMKETVVSIMRAPI